MTDLHRTFGSVTPPDTPKKQPTFDLQGTRASTGEAFTESFTCVAEPPFAVLDSLLSSITTDKTGRRVLNSPSLVNFLLGLVVEGDEGRLLDLLSDKDRHVKVEDVGEVVMWLAEVYSGGRPTSQSSS